MWEKKLAARELRRLRKCKSAKKGTWLHKALINLLLEVVVSPTFMVPRVRLGTLFQQGNRNKIILVFQVIFTLLTTLFNSRLSSSVDA